MCTVSYVPEQDGYIITSNRDETPSRSVCELAVKQIAGVDVHFPKDPKAGGSWFAFAESGYVACLLNGAYEQFDMSLEFPKSRGNVLIDSFAFGDVDDFVTSYAFKGAAPFTLLLLREMDIHEIIWDDQEIRHTILDPTRRHFWSSVTLYPERVRTWRKNLFEHWSEAHPDPTQDEIMRFHRFGGVGDDSNDFVMNRDNVVRTLSISSVHHAEGRSNFLHEDLLNPERSRQVAVEHVRPVAQSS